MKKKVKVTKGQKYGRLIIIKEVSPISSKRRILCKCGCGNIKEYSIYIINIKNDEYRVLLCSSLFF